MGNKILNSPLELFTRMLFSKVIERLAVIVGEENLSFSQVTALHIIDVEKSININDIASRLNLSLSATSRLVDELVKKNLIARNENIENRRAKILSLTGDGKNFLDRLSVERVKFIHESAHNLSGKILFNKFKPKKNKEKNQKEHK